MRNRKLIRFATLTRSVFDTSQLVDYKLSCTFSMKESLCMLWLKFDVYPVVRGLFFYLLSKEGGESRDLVFLFYSIFLEFS